MKMVIKEVNLKEYDNIDLHISNDSIQVSNDKVSFNAPIVVPEGMSLSIILPIIEEFIKDISTTESEIIWELLSDNGTKITIDKHSLLITKNSIEILNGGKEI